VKSTPDKQIERVSSLDALHGTLKHLGKHLNAKMAFLILTLLEISKVDRNLDIK